MTIFTVRHTCPLPVSEVRIRHARGDLGPQKISVAAAAGPAHIPLCDALPAPGHL